MLLLAPINCSVQRPHCYMLLCACDGLLCVTFGCCYATCTLAAYCCHYTVVCAICRLLYMQPPPPPPLYQIYYFKYFYLAFHSMPPKKAIGVGRRAHSSYFAVNRRAVNPSANLCSPGVSYPLPPQGPVSANRRYQEAASCSAL